MSITNIAAGFFSLKLIKIGMLAPFDSISKINGNIQCDSFPLNFEMRRRFIVGGIFSLNELRLFWVSVGPAIVYWFFFLFCAGLMNVNSFCSNGFGTKYILELVSFVPSWRCRLPNHDISLFSVVIFTRCINHRRHFCNHKSRHIHYMWFCLCKEKLFMQKKKILQMQRAERTMEKSQNRPHAHNSNAWRSDNGQQSCYTCDSGPERTSGHKSNRWKYDVHSQEIFRKFCTLSVFAICKSHYFTAVFDIW